MTPRETIAPSTGATPGATWLATPPLPLRVPPQVFDAYAWCASDWLAWSAPSAFRVDVAIDAKNPAGMLFLCREGTADFLPRELAHVHAPARLVGPDAWALAPYAIDDATDELYARRVRPRDALWLFAPDLGGLLWGLHDWAHFHHHGPFVERALTELQCDLCALVWLRLNQARVGLDDAGWERARASLAAVARARLVDEGKPVDAADALLDAMKLTELAQQVDEESA